MKQEKPLARAAMTCPKILRGPGRTLVSNPLGYRRSLRGRVGDSRYTIDVIAAKVNNKRAQARHRWELVHDGVRLATGCDYDALEDMRRAMECGVVLEIRP